MNNKLKKGTPLYKKMTWMLRYGSGLMTVAKKLNINYLELIQFLANERVEYLVRNNPLKNPCSEVTFPNKGAGVGTEVFKGANRIDSRYYWRIPTPFLAIQRGTTEAATEIKRLTAEALLLNYQNCVEASLELIVEEFPILVDKDFKDLVNIREYSYSDKFEVEVGGIVIIAMKEGGTPEFTEDWREKVSSAIKAKILSEMLKAEGALMVALGIDKEGDVK